MSNAHFTLFISDLHLDPSTPAITNHFLSFLSETAIHADALYILGDLFEAYIGDDDPHPFLQTIKNKLQAFTESGPPVYFMPGNRDFLVGRAFAKATGVQLITDPTCLDLYGKKIILMHGDSLCTLDQSHQRFRRITRNKFIQFLFLRLPLSFRQKLANQLRQESMQKNQQKSAVLMDVSQQAVIEEMTKHQVDTLIHGHTHRCATHEFQLNKMPAKRIVLDAWHDHGQYLRVDEQHNITSHAL